MQIPAYQDAYKDHDLQGLPLGIYLRLYHDHLEPIQFRELKQAALCLETRLSERAIRKILNRLVELRYIERDPEAPRTRPRYRLVFKRAKSVTADEFAH